MKLSELKKQLKHLDHEIRAIKRIHSGLYCFQSLYGNHTFFRSKTDALLFVKNNIVSRDPYTLQNDFLPVSQTFYRGKWYQVYTRI